MSNNSLAIIIDDEPASTEVLKILLNELGEISNILSFNDPFKGLEAIKNRKPDILFLDLEMPKLSGIDILKLIQIFKIHVHVIIITAHEQRIINAAHYGMIDYLLKPFCITELKSSIDKFKLHQDHNFKKQDIDKYLESYTHRIRIPTSFEEFYFSPKDIYYLEADGNYTVIYTTDGTTITSSYNLGKIQKLLPVKLFVRISRKVIINFSYLKKIDKRKKVCILNDINIEIPYSKNIITKSGFLTE